MKFVSVDGTMGGCLIDHSMDYLKLSTKMINVKLRVFNQKYGAVLPNEKFDQSV
jgi:hypothetical protein